MNKLFLTSIMLLSLTIMDASANQCPKALDFEIKRLGEDKVESLCQYKGKVILVVNTASKCGFTPQYEGLEKLYSEKKDEGLVVLGFPSHDFYQEPAPEQDIKDFCNLTYDVKFPMFTKVNVRGEKAHPFYKKLIAASGKEPKWNFAKYLIGRDGQVIEHYKSSVTPESERLVSAIQAVL